MTTTTDETIYAPGFLQEVYEQRHDQTIYYVNEAITAVVNGDKDLSYKKLDTLLGVMGMFSFTDTWACVCVCNAMDILEFGQRSIAKRTVKELNHIMTLTQQSARDEALASFYRNREELNTAQTDINDL